MNEIKIFNNQEFGEVRAIEMNGEAWLVGKDVTDKLGYQNGSRDIVRHVDEEDRANIVIHDGRQERTMVCVNESGLYSLILGSKLPTAKKFKHWVTSEVLPSIRKTGAYKIPLTKKEEMRLYYEALEEQDAKIEEVKKGIFNYEGGQPVKTCNSL